MKIGDIELKNNLFLAPMAGYTDLPFRRLCKKFGAGLTTTEMISVKGLLYDSEKTKILLETAEEEDVVAVQLFGHCPEDFEKALKMPELAKFDIIDINMGCPAPKIIKNGDGSALLKNIDLAEQIVKTCIKNTNKPVTVKLRLGFNNIVAVEFAKRMEQCGVSAKTVHGRLTTQGYSGKADYEEIKKVVDAVKIPVIANGDVIDTESYKLIKEKTGASGVMIGRGAIGNPTIFAELLGEHVSVDKFELIKSHYQDMLDIFPEKYAVVNMRKHIAQYLKNTGLSTDFKLKILTMDDPKEILDSLKVLKNK